MSNGHVIFYGVPSCMNLFLHTMVELLQLYIYIFSVQLIFIIMVIEILCIYR